MIKAHNCVNTVNFIYFWNIVKHPYLPRHSYFGLWLSGKISVLNSEYPSQKVQVMWKNYLRPRRATPVRTDVNQRAASGVQTNKSGVCVYKHTCIARSMFPAYTTSLNSTELLHWSKFKSLLCYRSFLGDPESVTDSQPSWPCRVIVRIK